MNKKILLGVLAGVALVAVAAGLSVWQVVSQGDNRGNHMMRKEAGREPGQFNKGSNDKEYRGRADGMNKKNGEQGRGMNRENCVADECLSVDGFDYPAGTLSDAAQEALRLAMTDEYNAQAFYQAVLGKFGQVRPFSMIIRAEEQHIAMLKALFDKYGMTVPENTVLAQAVPDTVSAACQTGVEAEQVNATLYREKLMPVVSNYPDITSVFMKLMNASQERHLPAFERCRS